MLMFPRTCLNILETNHDIYLYLLHIHRLNLSMRNNIIVRVQSSRRIYHKI